MLLCVFNRNWNVYALSKIVHLLIALVVVLLKVKGKMEKTLKGKISFGGKKKKNLLYLQVLG